MNVATMYLSPWRLLHSYVSPRGRLPACILGAAHRGRESLFNWQRRNQSNETKTHKIPSETFRKYKVPGFLELADPPSEKIRFSPRPPTQIRSNGNLRLPLVSAHKFENSTTSSQETDMQLSAQDRVSRGWGHSVDGKIYTGVPESAPGPRRVTRAQIQDPRQKQPLRRVRMV